KPCGCPPKPNGSTVAGLEPQRCITPEIKCRTLIAWVGTSATPENPPTPSARKLRTRSVYTICMGTFGNGVRTGSRTLTTPPPRLKIRTVPGQVLAAFFEVVPGAARSGTVALLIVMTYIHPFVTTFLGSGLSWSCPRGANSLADYMHIHAKTNYTG